MDTCAHRSTMAFVTDYMLGRQLPPSLEGVPSFWKVGDDDLVEHALSPRNNAPVCGYEGEIKVTEERWYESKSSKKCPVCTVRTGDDPKMEPPSY